MDEQLRLQLSRRLHALREDLESRIDDLDDRALAAPESASVGELSSYDQHPADLGAETFEREKDIALRELACFQLSQVESALQRMEEGTYGRCADCGQPIEEERLVALPQAERCSRCEARAEAAVREGPGRERRPREEELVEPPFARTFTDGSNSVELDGEDAWQAVARYGPANSPQDAPDAIDYEDTVEEGDEALGIVQEVEGVIDLSGQGVSDLEAIYPDPEGRPQRRPHRQEMRE